MGHGAWGMGHGAWGMAMRGEFLTQHSQSPILNSQSPIPNPQFINKSFQPSKQLLEKSYMSPTIEIAETNVSVHSSHHTPPGLLFGRFLMFVNKIRELLCKCTSLDSQAEVFAMVEFSPSSDIIGEGFRHVNSRTSYRL